MEFRKQRESGCRARALRRRRSPLPHTRWGKALDDRHHGFEARRLLHRRRRDPPRRRLGLEKSRVPTEEPQPSRLIPNLANATPRLHQCHPSASARSEQSPLDQGEGCLEVLVVARARRDAQRRNSRDCAPPGPATRRSGVELRHTWAAILRPPNTPPHISLDSTSGITRRASRFQANPPVHLPPA